MASLIYFACYVYDDNLMLSKISNISRQAPKTGTPAVSQIKIILGKPPGPCKRKIRLKGHQGLVLPPGESVFATSSTTEIRCMPVGWCTVIFPLTGSLLFLSVKSVII